MSEKLILGLVLTQIAVLIGKIVYDWLKEGRTDPGQYLLKKDFEKHGDYLLKSEFEKHRRECCVLDLKTDFNKHKQSDSAHDANVDQRLSDIERRLEENHNSFIQIYAELNKMNIQMAEMLGMIKHIYRKEDFKDL